MQSQSRSELSHLHCNSAFCLAVTLLFSSQAKLAAQNASPVDQALPYSFPIVLPSIKSSPPEDPSAPYTSTVVSLIKQLEPHSPPTPAELAIAAALLTTHGGTYAHPDGSNPTCHNLANVNVKAATTPRIMPLCFSDGLGINVDSGPNVGRTTGLPSMLMLASTFDRELANAMGQVEGREGRNLMVTGLLGPQADTDVFVNWQRGHHTSGEDPFLNGVMSAAQINGIQGQGLMSQVKHYAVYYGAGGSFTDVQDQALHEPRVFSSQMVFERAMPIHVWVEAASAEQVTLSVSAINTLEFNDILIGDIWMPFGQSNMELPRKSAKRGGSTSFAT